MTLYSLRDGSLSLIKEKSFKLEKEIQRLFENNLFGIMGLQFVKSEFNIKNRRIDTLAFDPQSKSFVIIEYKREKNISVVDQGFTYLSLMLENKADFIVEYNEILRKTLKRDDVDWSQTRVTFVSPSFTENQVQATNFRDIAIELWEVKQYENGAILINQIKKSSSAASIKPLTEKNLSLKAVTEEIKVYSEEEHLLKASDYSAELYERIKSGIIGLGDGIEVKPKKMEIGFQKNGKIFTDVSILKGGVKMWLNLKKGSLDDPKGISRDVSSTGHWGNGDYEIKLEDDSNLEYVLSLIKQAIPS